MGQRKVRIWIIQAVLAVTAFSPALAQEGLSAYPAVIHIHSMVSSGDYPLRRVIRQAQDKGIKVLIFTDSLVKRWEYGIFPAPNIFKLSVEESSISRYGIKRYLNDFKAIKDEFPSMLILGATEVAPFYWWSGSFFKRNLCLNDLNRHLLVIGLEKENDYRYLPVLYNRYLLPRFKDMPSLLISALLICSGILLLKKRGKKKPGVFILATGVLFLFNHIPFSASSYSPYSGPRQYAPCQELIDYANKRKALTFWAHPEITQETAGGRFARTVSFSTLKYPEALSLTRGYAGFGVGAKNDLILAGREWDKVLNSYCLGRRKEPAWVIAEADYRGGGQIDSIQNMIFLPELKESSALEALRRGRLYIRYYSQGKCDVRLEDFSIRDSSGAISVESAFIGGEITVKEKPRLSIRGTLSPNGPEELSLEVIRNGASIKEFKLSGQSEFVLEFQDDSLEIREGKNYYRLNFFIGNRLVLATNPIFVRVNNG